MAEYRVAVELMARGFGVAFPSDDHLPFDLISISGQKMIRLQVKTTNRKDDYGFYAVRFLHKVGAKKKYTKKACDFFLVMIPYKPVPAFYIIPVGDVGWRWKSFPGTEKPLKRGGVASQLERYRDAWWRLR